MYIYYACIKERYSKTSYTAHKFTTCNSKQEVKKFCKENGFVISGNKVYTEKQWRE